MGGLRWSEERSEEGEGEKRKDGEIRISERKEGK